MKVGAIAGASSHAKRCVTLRLIDHLFLSEAFCFPRQGSLCRRAMEMKIEAGLEATGPGLRVTAA